MQVRENKYLPDGRKSAWIFGGTSDIGKGLIAALFSYGFQIHFTWNSQPEVAGELLDKFPGAQGYKLDLSCDPEVNDFCACYQAALISNLFIYCAGVNNAGFCDELMPAQLEAITKINFTSAAKIFNAASHQVKANKSLHGRFVYISSVSAKKVSVGNALYGASKIAMERYLSGMAAELARFNIRTLSIRPGYIHTRMLESYCFIKGISLNELQKNIPARRFLVVKDIADVVVSFALDNIVTTGTVITVGNGEELM